MVYDFYVDCFFIIEEIFVFFGGDFNVVFYIDGGDSFVLRKLFEVGFIDVFWSLNLDF